MTEPISVTALNQYIKGLLDRDRLLSRYWSAVKFQIIKCIPPATIIFL